MTASGNNGEAQDQVETEAKPDFGESLRSARESQNLTVADIAKAIHLSEEIINAIEHSDVSRLPQPTFVQGYLRAYAKYLGLKPESIVENFSNAVPHARETKLQPRSKLKTEATSGSPFVKSVSIMLVVVIILAVVYGLYSYYSEAVNNKKFEGPETGSDSILVIPENEISSRPFIQDDTSANSVFSDLSGTMSEQPVQMEPAVESDEQPVDEVTEPVASIESEEPVLASTPGKQLNTITTAVGDDVIEVLANEDSWTEIVDANEAGLIYDLIKQGQEVKLTGTAPFDIFLGNAPGMEIRVNGIPVDMTKYIRSNKIAHFSVSTDGQQVVFH